jgi:hypothetical protein
LLGLAQDRSKTLAVVSAVDHVKYELQTQRVKQREYCFSGLTPTASISHRISGSAKLSAEPFKSFQLFKTTEARRAVAKRSKLPAFDFSSTFKPFFREAIY